MKNSFFTLALITLFCSAYASNAKSYSLLLQAHEEGDPCIVEIQEEKIFLFPERITISQAGIFLELNSFGPIPISNVYSGSEGIYVLSKPYYVCRKCNLSYYQPGNCRKCGGPLFKVQGI